MTDFKTKSLKMSNGFSNTITSTSNLFNSAALAKRRKEKQGPTDWTHLGLKSKYRDENNREDGWKDWKTSQKLSTTVLYDIHEVVPIIKVERHPLHLWYHERLNLENESSNERTRSRLLMKRFVFDVQELWLANLEHLREHQSSQMFTDEEEEHDNYQRGRGLKNRRDTKEISSMNHQVQAVSQKRAFANAYHTTRLPQVNLILDYVSFRTPTLPSHIPLPPQIRSILAHIRLEPDNQSLHAVDGNPCMEVVSHGLTIDRMVPSADYISFIGQDILWRFELIESTTLKRKLYICKEDDVVQYITAAILCSPIEFDSHIVFNSEVGVNIQPIEAKDGLSTWKITKFSIIAKISSTLTASTRAVQICTEASLESNERPYDQSEFRLEFQISLLELYFIVYREYGIRISLFREDVVAELRQVPWSSLVTKFKVKCDDSRLPIALYYDEPDTFLKNIDGALSDLQAHGCAYELMRIFSYPSRAGGCILCAPTMNGVDLNLIDVTDSNEEKRSLYRSMNRETFLEDKIALAKVALYYGLWEELLEFSTCLSMHSNALNFLTQDVPGSCEIGKKGLWFMDELDPTHEKTQCAASFFRDPIKSSTDTIMVNMTLALETAILFRPVVAWENFSHSPASYPGEESRAVSSLASQFSWNNQIQGLKSPIESRISDTVVIFGTFPLEGVDYLPRDAIHRPTGFKRYVPMKNQYGFREQLEVNLLSLDAHVDSHVYGITKSGAIPNNLGVNSRNIWHNVIAISEHINRPRIAKDYHYIIANPNHCGANIPTSYTTRMKALEMVGLTSSVLKHFEDTYSKIKELRNVFNKQLALDTKIEKIENELKVKDALKRRLIQDQLQRSLEKKLNKATKSEIGWKRRFRCSTLLELQGNWERRRDDRTGLIFFHKIVADSRNEKFLNTCQWEVPTEWDGDMWNNPSLDMHLLREALAYNKEDHHSNITSQPSMNKSIEQSVEAQSALAAFAEPTSNWLPSNEAEDNTTLGLRETHKIVANIETKSTAAEKSYVPSSVSSLGTSHIEQIAEQLLSSDELIKIIAKRLGIPESQVVGVDDMSSVFSVSSSVKQANLKRNNDNKPLNAPRDLDYDELHEPEFDSDEDLWSDDEIEVGDFDPLKEISPDQDLPENQLEAARLRRKEAIAATGNKIDDQVSVPSTIPYLDLTGVAGISNAKVEQNQERYGWRRLPRPVFGDAFLTNALKTHTRGPDSFSCNTINAPVFLVPISPVDACKYIPEQFSIPVESLFIPDAKKDMERSVATLERNIRIEEELARNMPSDDLFLFGEAKEFTSVDAFLARQYKEDKAAVSDPKEAAKEQALLAAKATNIAQMEDALAEDIPINTADEFGNTLLILAAQQGSKRMCKFLLRRGANINIQNLTGNTALHYCYAYSNRSLGEYLKAKGADDSIINVDGLTCYEGLNRENMNQTYADYDEEDYFDSQEEGDD